MKIKKKWIYKEDKTLYSTMLSIQGWIGAIILLISGIVILLEELELS